MSRKILILSLTSVAVVGALAWRAQGNAARAEPTVTTPVELAGETEAQLPRLIELGSDSCASCQAMMPVLADLRAVNDGELLVDFIDVWKYPEQAEPYGVQLIPTQVFLGPDGVELFRHQGFFSAEDIRARWYELGFDLTGAPLRL